ncbi:MAG: hypothetical protein PHX83_04200 [Acidobacteriia bacterium]|nr:hypothetical protein [Terriglobia bacterium]
MGIFDWMSSKSGSTPTGFATGRDPVCPQCRTIYNRVAVIREIKKQSPFLFDFPVWTTKFRCIKCRTEIEISGVQGE